MFAFTYDAWNRLVKVTKAYRDPEDSYNLKADMVVNTLEYDALHRRIKKAVSNSGPLDCTYHYYYDGQQIVEMHNGSEQTIQQFVWGQTYIDELVQVGLNDDPNDATEQNIETTHYALSNANYNVIGLIDDSGALVERYEYTPYGERQVYTSAGLNDPDCYAPVKKSRRVQVAGIDQPWGINPVGHQGLFHDEETRLIDNDARLLHPRLGRFINRDPLGYPNGLNAYEYVGGNPINRLDPTGQYEYEWEGKGKEVWTSAQKKKITDSHKRVQKRVQDLLKQLDDLEAELEKCIVKKLKDKLNQLRDRLKAIDEGVGSTDNYELSHKKLAAGTEAETYPWGWYGIKGGWSDAQTAFNDALLPIPWDKYSDGELDRLTFHELIHVEEHGDKDHDGDGTLVDGHYLDDTITSDLNDWSPLQNEIRMAKRKCDKEQENCAKMKP